MHDIPPGETWNGIPARNAKRSFREIAAISHLPEMLREFKARQREEARRESSSP